MASQLLAQVLTRLIGNSGTNNLILSDSTSAPESAALWGDYLQFTADSLAQSKDASDTLTVSAQQMFGPSSYICDLPVEGLAANLTGPLLTDSLVFHTVALVCFALYCVTLYLYHQQSGVLLSVFRSKLYVDTLLGERNYTFDNFLNSMVALGVFTLSLAGVKAADIAAGPGIAAALPEWTVFLMAPVVWVVLGLVFLFQTVSLKLAGRLTYSLKIASRLRYLRKINFSVASTLLTPFFLMYALSGKTGFSALSVAIGTVLSVVVIFHLVRTYILFVDEKISKLYWFLYLCGVEIFPVTFLLLSLQKLLS